MIRSLTSMSLVLLLLVGCSSGADENTSRTFQFEMNFTYPADPVTVYEHLTGDISAWWDHSFSGNPLKMYIEAKPGGGFYEIFDDSGDGVKHATVTYAKRGEMLRFEGPLGLAGQALTMVCTYTLEPSGGNGTQLNLDVHAAGEFTEGTPEVVRQVWEHFLWEQFRPYLAGKVSP
jgi:hypothetical protein